MVDPNLFAKLKEGQQVAVIQFHDTNTASVDLFISILDQTGESHEIVFFVPLGVKADGFAVREQDSLAFNEQYTRRLDMPLFQAYRRDQEFMQYLFAGALLTNGVWLTPLWLPLLFTGCAGVPPPISTFKTDSSEVSIFGLEESTDLEALISTTGLDPSVTETLSRLRGQQIAVVNLRTQPQQTATGSTTEGAPTGEPGLHLSWQTTLATSESGATYAYPLGTGAAWAHPIEMTRVYLLVPEDLDFTVCQTGWRCLSKAEKTEGSKEMRMLQSAVIFTVGCAILLAAFGIGWADWGRLANRIGIMQILMGVLGVMVVLLVVLGILSRGKERWIALLFVAILLLGFSALTFASTGIIVVPIGLLILGFSIWKLLHRRTELNAF